MAEKERIIKIIWGVKGVKNSTLHCLSEYTEKEILSMVNKAKDHKKKGKSDKVEIITAITNDDMVKYKRYYFDSKTEFSYGECAVSISAKGKNNKTLTFEDKLGLLENWMKKKNKLPKVGDMENEFDVGKFYHQSITNAKKMKEVITLAEQYTQQEEEDN